MGKVMCLHRFEWSSNVWSSDAISMQYLRSTTSLGFCTQCVTTMPSFGCKSRWWWQIDIKDGGIVPKYQSWWSRAACQAWRRSKTHASTLHCCQAWLKMMSIEQFKIKRLMLNHDQRIQRNQPASNLSFSRIYRDSRHDCRPCAVVACESSPPASSTCPTASDVNIGWSANEINASFHLWNKQKVRTDSTISSANCCPALMVSRLNDM